MQIEETYSISGKGAVATGKSSQDIYRPMQWLI